MDVIILSLNNDYLMLGLTGFINNNTLKKPKPIETNIDIAHNQISKHSTYPCRHELSRLSNDYKNDIRPLYRFRYCFFVLQKIMTTNS